jgi:uncharacterized protein (DUF1778 family)
MPKTKKTKTQNKSNYLTIRLSDEDRNRLAAMAEAAGMTMSQYARSAIFNAEVVTILQDTSLLRAQNLLLAQFGNNLNHLARHANRYRGGADSAMLTASIRALDESWRASFGLGAAVAGKAG